MSWDAELYVHPRGMREQDGCDECLGSWDYTHNCNDMIAAAIEDRTGEVIHPAGGPLGPACGPAWWKHLDAKAGVYGAMFLDRIIKSLEADPERFRAMNPENGWGDYDGLVKVLTEMRNAVPEAPCWWSVSG